MWLPGDCPALREGRRNRVGLPLCRDVVVPGGVRESAKPARTAALLPCICLVQRRWRLIHGADRLYWEDLVPVPVPRCARPADTATLLAHLSPASDKVRLDY